LSNRQFLKDASVVTLIGILVVFVLYLGVVAGWWGSQSVIAQLVREHPAALVGVPIAAITSLFLVLLLEIVRGEVEFKIGSLEFKGAAAPITFWVLSFAVLAGAIEIAWKL
jgi:hypothetical protein